MVSVRSLAVLGILALGASACSTVLGIDGDWTEAGASGTGGSGAGSTSGSPTPASASATGSGANGGSGVGASGPATTSGTGASGGAASSTGAGASGGGGGSGCPGNEGPVMVDLGAYCIDSTEVTNAQYLAFLDAGVPLQGTTGPAYCAWNLDYTPQGGLPPNGMDRPVANVDWCDAYAYCAWAGKRLCGNIGSGPADFAIAGDAMQQWYSACANGSGTAYTYGDVYDPTICNGMDLGMGASVPVASLAGCHGLKSPLDAVHDLTGNVREWEDACNAQTGATDTCRRRGGSFLSPQGVMTCDDASFNSPRDDMSDAIGFRCCSP